MQSDNILEIENLSVGFGGRHVVEGLSLSLRRGETLGIVGESGSGKSVSSLSLMGLLPATATVSGHAWLAGKGKEEPPVDLLSLGEEELRRIRGQRISMIFQEPMTSLNPSKRCGQQVEEMLLLHEQVSRSEAKERVLQLFNEVMLPRPENIYNSYPHEISGGQKQRVMIAMALICSPDIIIADEPTTALDVTVQKAILDLLRTLQQRRGMAVIFITHDLGVIAQLAHRVAVMYKGHMVEEGLASEVLYHPQHPYTKGLLACRPPLDSRPRRLPTVASFLDGETSQPEVSHDARISHVGEDAQPLLRVRNLRVEYALERSLTGRVKKSLNAVDGISFDIFKGETLGLVGESGCGKSTLGRALLRLIDTADGTIEYNGVRLDTMTVRQMRQLRTKLQIIFQDPYSSLNPRITVGEAILEPLRIHNIGNDASERIMQVKTLMEQVGLPADSFNRYPHEFSGGQRQRVCIARALVLKPELVVCDESVSALDVSVQAQVLNLLSDLKEQYGFTCLFITHDLSVVKFISDRIMVMRQGRIVEQGESDELYAHPQEEYTRSLLDAIPRL
ncbi:MAG: ABC transporter ATP-binding protein [Bacteroidales bacterium]|nr:ABC transporter ATP-binding protein [Bacteroidales bacterium]